MKKVICFIYVLSLLAVMCGQVSAAPKYTVTDLNMLTGIQQVADVNNRGMIVGNMSSSAGTKACAWQAETGLVDLGYGRAMAVSDTGFVACRIDSLVGFLWNPTTHTTSQFNNPGNITDVNDIGQVVGYNGNNQAFIWEAGLGMTELGIGGARAVINSGQVAGSIVTPSGYEHAFIWQAGTGMTDLGTLGGTRSYANAINDAGQVVGGSQTASGDIHAFIWDKDNGMVDLGGFGAETNAISINNRGQVLANTYLANCIVSSLLWQKETGWVELNNLVDLPPNTFASAKKILDDGSILARIYTTQRVAVCDVLLMPIVIHVQIDIKPGTTPNVLNLRSNGLFQVAIFSTAGFDATTIDPATITLAGASPSRMGKAPVVAKIDINRDGRKDLVPMFSCANLQLNASDKEAVLTGKTFDGTSIEGKDSVVVIPKK